MPLQPYSAGQCDRILPNGGDAIFVGDVLFGLGHRIGVIGLIDREVNEARADGRVVNLGMARKGNIGLRTQERDVDHAFDVARSNLARRHQHGIHARSAHAVDCGACHADRQTARSTAFRAKLRFFLTGLIGAAIHHVVDRIPIHAPVARNRRPPRRDAEPFDRAVDAVADENKVQEGHSDTGLRPYARAAVASAAGRAATASNQRCNRA